MIHMHLAAREGTVQRAAMLYHNAGLSIIPVDGKTASLQWGQYQRKRAQYGQMVYWFSDKYPQRGLAVVLGEVSRNLVCIDLDGQAAVDNFRSTFPHLLDTFTVASGSGNGQHLYFQLADAPTVRAPGYELRARGSYVVLPPSIHPSGNPYKVFNDAPARDVPHLHDVIAFIEEQRPRPQYTPTATRQRQASQPRPSSATSVWIAVAVQREIENLRRSREGNANNTLNAVAYRLARITAHPSSGLSADDVRSKILEAASHLTERDGFSATMRTLNSGWFAGWSNPITDKELANGRRQ